MVKIVGREKVKARMAKMRGPEAVKAVGQALFIAGQRIQVDAQHSITEGSISGKGHVASRPGEPPNADTHGLDRQIETVQVGPMRVQVSANAIYSKFLEFGTSRMAARPFLLPAAQRQQRHVRELVTQALNRVSKGR